MLFNQRNSLFTENVLEETKKIEILPAQEDTTLEVLEIDISDLGQREWESPVFKDGEEGFSSFGKEVSLETKFTLEDIIYFSTEDEMKEMVEKYDKTELKKAFFELYYLYIKIMKEATEKAKNNKKGN